MFGSSGAPTPEGTAGMPDSSEFQDMMKMFQGVMKDPKMKGQAENIWKMLDEMQSKDPKEYREFVE
jgi:hypothetical protein